MRRHGAFTLKEVFVALVIIGMLLALLFPVYRIVRYRISEARCRANLWAILTKYQQLKAEFNGKVGTKEFREAFRAWMASPAGLKVCYCPLDPSPYSFSEKVSYHYYVDLTGRPIDQVDYLSIHNPEVIAACRCHKKPVGRSCKLYEVEGEKRLAAFESGEVRYADYAKEITLIITDKDEIKRRLEEGRREYERSWRRSD